MFNEIDVNIEKKYLSGLNICKYTFIFNEYSFYTYFMNDIDDIECVEYILKNSDNLKIILLNYKNNSNDRIKDYYDYIIKNKDCKINLVCNF